MEQTDSKCPLCKKATAFHIYKTAYKCRRQENGCGKIFQGIIIDGILNLVDKKVAKGQTHTEITCKDCRNKRTVKTQDAFQVKRCITCQKKFRSKSRRYDFTGRKRSR